MRKKHQDVFTVCARMHCVGYVIVTFLIAAPNFASAQTPETPIDPPIVEQIPPAETVVAPTEIVPIVEVTVTPVPELPVVEPAPETHVAELPTAQPVAVETVVATIPGTDVNPVEAESDPAESTGIDPGTATPTATAMETPTLATQVPTAMPATPSPSPTVSPSPTPAPSRINWSQPHSITCQAVAGNASALELNDTATWQCTATMQANTIGEVPSDLAILWTISAAYSGDDVQIALPSNSLAVVHQPDLIFGGAEDNVIFRTNWTDGSVLNFNVTVTRTSCVVGAAELRLAADIELVTADAEVVITNTGEAPVDTLLASTSKPNEVEPEITISPIQFSDVIWDGFAYSSAQATGSISIANPYPCPTESGFQVIVEFGPEGQVMRPAVTHVESGDRHVTVHQDGGLTIATIAPGFTGTISIDFELKISPTNEVATGIHSFGIHVSLRNEP